MRLVKAVKAGRVDVVVAEGLDRLSRTLKDIAGIYESLDYHQVMIWTAHEGRISELHIGLKGTMNALFLRDMKARVKRGQKARVEAGYAASSCAYGYRPVRGVVDAKGRNVNGVREIDEAAAQVIRRVYDEYIAGRKIPKIVEGLNADGIPAPNGGLWKRNAIMGGAKKQEGILRNEIYTGKLIFNRSHVVRDPITNRKKYVANPESQWTKVEVPHLRIISDAQWAAVRLLDSPKQGAPRKRKTPEGLTVYNQHALTGWIKCGWCGGSKSLANDTRYLCSNHRYTKTCANSRGTKEPVLMTRTFAALYRRLESGPDFTPALERFFARENQRREQLTTEQDEARSKIQRLMEAVERGVDPAYATERILELQDSVERIRTELQTALPAPLPEEPMIRAQLTNAVQSVELSKDVPTQRAMFKQLLSEIVLTPIPDKHQGETVAITLREEGWPEFWRSITTG